MDIKELQQLGEPERARLLLELREKIREFRFKSARREVKNVREIRATRKTIARLLTLLKK